MASISDLYFQTKALHDERVAWQVHHPPSGQVMREIETLKRIGQLLVDAYEQAGGTKTAEHEHQPGATPYQLPR